MPGTPRADPSVVQVLRKKREKSVKLLQEEFPHHLSNTKQLQQVPEHGLTYGAQVCVCEPSLDFLESQRAPRTHHPAHQKSVPRDGLVDRLHFLYQNIIYIVLALHPYL